MSAWRLEMLRWTRSARGIALISVYLFFGFAGPVMATYMDEIAKLASSGVTIIAPEPRPADGIVNYVSQGSQTGMIVLTVIAAGVLSLDARRGLAIFYRTRADRPMQLLWPRYVTTTAIAVAAYVLGTAAAWLETTVLLGPLPAGRVLLGAGLEAVFLLFAIAVVAAAATVGRSTLSTAAVSLAVLLIALPIAGILPAVGTWLPTKLLTAPAGLVNGTPAGDYRPAVAVSLVATVLLLALTARRSRRREL
jgi:ABC-2 type transport system permease protein